MLVPGQPLLSDSLALANDSSPSFLPEESVDCWTPPGVAS